MQMREVLKLEHPAPGPFVTHARAPSVQIIPQIQQLVATRSCGALVRGGRRPG
jgi:hypothetical protein